MNMTMREIIEKYKEQTGKSLSDASIANILGWSKTTMSFVVNGTYANLDSKLEEAYNKLLGDQDEASAGAQSDGFEEIVVKTDVIVATPDFNAVYGLCNGLMDPKSSLTASIGMVTGVAGRGKTTTVRRFAVEHPGVVYILYMGYSKSSLFRVIAEEMTGRSFSSYYKNLQLILEATRAWRKLIIIDEADRMPLNLIEDLRTLNESGSVPLLLVGEPALASMTKRADRIESRIRKPRIEFHPLDYVVLSTLYKEACGLTLTKGVAEKLVKAAGADFRVAANDMQNIVRLMNINHQSVLTERLIDEFRKI